MGKTLFYTVYSKATVAFSIFMPNPHPALIRFYYTFPEIFYCFFLKHGNGLYLKKGIINV